MVLADILSGARFVAERALDRFVVQPRRRRQWARKARPFLFTSPEGHKFELHPQQLVDKEIFHDGIYEKRFLRFLRGRFPEGSIALDIGANIGNHSIYLATSFAQIHAFEPNPAAIKRLKKNISFNGLESRICVHPVGLGEKDETLPFKENRSGNLGGSRFVKQEEAEEADPAVKSLRIAHADGFIASLSLPRIDFVKVDVEGWEPSVFRGLRGTIARYRPIIAFEFHGHLAAPQDFENIAGTMPDYIFVEARHAPHDLSMPRKFAWNVTRRGRPHLERVATPEARTYENIIAFPSAESLVRFDS